MLGHDLLGFCVVAETKKITQKMLISKTYEEQYKIKDMRFPKITFK